MQRRGFLGLLGAVPIAIAAPTTLEARRRPLPAAPPSRPPLLIEGKDIYVDTLEIQQRIDGSSAQFETPLLTVEAGMWIRIVVDGAFYFTGRVQRVTRRSRLGSLLFSEVYAEA